MVYAFAIAGTQASGLREVFGSMCKPFHAGKAAQNGTVAAMLAQRGFIGTDGIFEGPRGLVGVMATGHDITQATKNLGSHWELPANGLKPYACAQANHGFLDATLALRKKKGVSPETVKHIQGSVCQFAPALVRRRHPRNGLEAKFCYYHSIAVALIDGQALPAQYTDARSTDPAVEDLRNRIDVSEDPSLPRRAASVTVELNDGTTYTETIPHATGTPGNPMSDAMVQQIGTSREIHENPRNRFVASFIGSPAMNFLHGTLSAHGAGHAVILKDGTVIDAGPVDGARDEAKVTLGLRPEHLRPVPLPGAHLAGRIVLIEELGASRLVHLDTANGRLVSNVPVEDAGDWQLGDDIGLAVAPKHTHLFDRARGFRLDRADVQETATEESVAAA